MTIINKCVADTTIPPDLDHFVGLLNRKLGADALLELQDGSNDVSVKVVVFRHGDYCGELRQVGGCLLIHNTNIVKHRTRGAQKKTETYTTKFGVGVDNSTALKLADRSLKPLSMLAAFTAMEQRVDAAYSQIRVTLRLDVERDYGKYLGAWVNSASKVLGMGPYYNSHREAYLFLGSLAEKIVAGDKDGLFAVAKSIFDDSTSVADDFEYKYGKLVQFESDRNSSGTTTPSRLYIEELRNNHVRVIRVNEARALLSAYRLGSDANTNGHSPGTAAWHIQHPAAKRYATTYPNLHALPQDIFESISTLKAAGCMQHIPKVGVMLDSVSWFLEDAVCA